WLGLGFFNWPTINTVDTWVSYASNRTERLIMCVGIGQPLQCFVVEVVELLFGHQVSPVVGGTVVASAMTARTRLSPSSGFAYTLSRRTMLPSASSTTHKHFSSGSSSGTSAAASGSVFGTNATAKCSSI